MAAPSISTEATHGLGVTVPDTPTVPSIRSLDETPTPNRTNYFKENASPGLAKTLAKEPIVVTWDMSANDKKYRNIRLCKFRCMRVDAKVYADVVAASSKLHPFNRRMHKTQQLIEWIMQYTEVTDDHKKTVKWMPDVFNSMYKACQFLQIVGKNDSDYAKVNLNFENAVEIFITGMDMHKKVLMIMKHIDIIVQLFKNNDSDSVNNKKIIMDECQRIINSDKVVSTDDTMTSICDAILMSDNKKSIADQKSLSELVLELCKVLMNQTAS
jgi:hypothetical protein